jgi:glyoxalase-like protein
MKACQVGLTLALLTTFTAGGDASRQPNDDLLSRINHLVYATRDLDRGIEEIEKLLGVRASPGGQHQGLGTRNALVAVGPNAYMEIFAPDPDQPEPTTPRPYGLDALKASRLVAWFVKGGDLARIRTLARERGVPLGEVKSGTRRRADGVEWSWQFTDPWNAVADGVVPFFIDWGTSPHPSQTATKGLSLVSLRAEHPDVDRAKRMLQELGLRLSVTTGPIPSLIAVIDGPRGRVELR